LAQRLPSLLLGKTVTIFLSTQQEGRFAMSFSLVPLLIGEESISPEIRQALQENHLLDAAELITQEYGLSCVEASQLLDVSACDRYKNQEKTR
jgi:hypothetical protein